jgi:hypothetical protein
MLHQCGNFKILHKIRTAAAESMTTLFGELVSVLNKPNERPSNHA